MWAAIKAACLAFLARWAGKREGRAEQQAVDRVKAGLQERDIKEAVYAANAKADATRDGVAGELREGTF